jgi:hypothetical protein
MPAAKAQAGTSTAQSISVDMNIAAEEKREVIREFIA